MAASVSGETRGSSRISSVKLPGASAASPKVRSETATRSPAPCTTRRPRNLSIENHSRNCNAGRPGASGMRAFYAPSPGTWLASRDRMPIRMSSRRVAGLAACVMMWAAWGASPVGGQQREVVAPEAWAALQDGDAAKAASIFRQELERRPSDPYLYYGAGWAAHVLGREEAAISALKKAVEIEPRFSQALAMLAEVAYGSGDIDLAIRSLEKATRLNPR